jgi:hypothetical protein
VDKEGKCCKDLTHKQCKEKCEAGKCGDACKEACHKEGKTCCKKK